MADALTNLSSEVAEIEDLATSIDAFITGMKQQLDAALAAGNDAAIVAEAKALSDRLDTAGDSIRDSILRNTETKPDVLPPPPVPAETTGEDTNSAPESVDNGQQPGAPVSEDDQGNLGDNAEDNPGADTNSGIQTL